MTRKDTNCILCKDYQAHLPDAGAKLLEYNNGMIYDFVNKKIKERKMLNACFQYEDAIQEASIGVLDAASRYDGNHSFSTYAYYYMFQRCFTAWKQAKNCVHVPMKLDYSTEAIPFYETINFEDDDEILLEDILCNQDISVEDVICKKSFTKILRETLLSTLNSRELYVIILRFGLDGFDYLPLAKIGKRLGVQQERIRQIEAKALRHIRYPRHSSDLKMFKDINFDSSYEETPIFANIRDMSYEEFEVAYYEKLL